MPTSLDFSETYLPDRPARHVFQAFIGPKKTPLSEKEKKLVLDGVDIDEYKKLMRLMKINI